MKLKRKDNGREFRLISDNGGYAIVLDIVADVRMTIKSDRLMNMFEEIDDDQSN